MEPFPKEKVIISVRIEAWISIVDLIIPAGISPTGVAFVPFGFDFFFSLSLLHETLYVRVCFEQIYYFSKHSLCFPGRLTLIDFGQQLYDFCR